MSLRIENFYEGSEPFTELCNLARKDLEACKEQLDQMDQQAEKTSQVAMKFAKLYLAGIHLDHEGKPVKFNGYINAMGDNNNLKFMTLSFNAGSGFSFDLTIKEQKPETVKQSDEKRLDVEMKIKGFKINPEFNPNEKIIRAVMMIHVHALNEKGLIIHEKKRTYELNNVGKPILTIS